MRFGAFLPTYWDDYGEHPLHVAIEETALAAEALGYDGVWANDQVINPAATRPGTLAAAHVIEPFVTLASLVHLVPRLTLGIAVLILPQRSAILVAKQTASLHPLSRQRFILGVGVGHRAQEFEILGANFADYGSVTDEAIDVLQTLWREPNVSYHGRFHNFNAVHATPRLRWRTTHLDWWQFSVGDPAAGQVRQRVAALWDRPRRLAIRRERAAGPDT